MSQSIRTFVLSAAIAATGLAFTPVASAAGRSQPAKPMPTR